MTYGLNQVMKNMLGGGGGKKYKIKNKNWSFGRASYNKKNYGRGVSVA